LESSVSISTIPILVGRTAPCGQSPWLAISQTYLSALFSCQRAIGYSAY